MRYYHSHLKLHAKQPQEVLYKNSVLKNIAKFTVKTGTLLPVSLLYSFIVSLITLLKGRFCHRCLPVNFAKFPRLPFLQNTSGRENTSGSSFRIGILSFPQLVNLVFRILTHNEY